VDAEREKQQNKLEDRNDNGARLQTKTPQLKKSQVSMEGRNQPSSLFHALARPHNVVS